jgi:acid stress-induced BolA-like protein IbaG/YrbA
MEELRSKILRALNESDVPISDSSFEFSERGNIGGILISSAFTDMDETDRQTLVLSKLKQKLTEDDLQHIVSLITVTPYEDSLFKKQA